MAIALALAAGACGGGGEEPPRADIDASTYVAAIEGFLPTDPDPDNRPVVYVVPVADEALALGTQVAVIDALAETYDVRFVDSPGAAVDEGSADEPARDGGMLLGVGVVSVEPPHTIRIEVYEDRDEVAAHLVTVALRGGLWEAVGDEPVEPEVLVGD
jgi:hypothetical protein